MEEVRIIIGTPPGPDTHLEAIYNTRGLYGGPAAPCGMVARMPNASATRPTLILLPGLDVSRREEPVALDASLPRAEPVESVVPIRR